MVAIWAMMGVRQGLRKGHWSQLRFHGDEMLRPVTSNEIGWLAVASVRLSMRINRALGFDDKELPSADEQVDNVFQVGRMTSRPGSKSSQRDERMLLCCAQMAWVISSMSTFRVSLRSAITRHDDLEHVTCVAGYTNNSAPVAGLGAEGATQGMACEPALPRGQDVACVAPVRLPGPAVHCDPRAAVHVGGHHDALG